MSEILIKTIIFLLMLISCKSPNSSSSQGENFKQETPKSNKNFKKTAGRSDLNQSIQFTIDELIEVDSRWESIEQSSFSLQASSLKLAEAESEDNNTTAFNKLLVKHNLVKTSFIDFNMKLKSKCVPTILTLETPYFIASVAELTIDADKIFMDLSKDAYLSLIFSGDACHDENGKLHKLIAKSNLILPFITKVSLESWFEYFNIGYDLPHSLSLSLGWKFLKSTDFDVIPLKDNVTVKYRYAPGKSNKITLDRTPTGEIDIPPVLKVPEASDLAVYKPVNLRQFGASLYELAEDLKISDTKRQAIAYKVEKLASSDHQDFSFIFVQFRKYGKTFGSPWIVTRNRN